MIDVGSVWRDRDRRSLSGNRMVRVLRVDGQHVYYVDRYDWDRHTARKPYRSKAARFVKAFEKIEEKT
jgi:hypothetical protein